MEELSHAFERYKHTSHGTGAYSAGHDRARHMPPPTVYTRTRVVECQEALLRRNRVVAQTTAAMASISTFTSGRNRPAT